MKPELKSKLPNVPGTIWGEAGGPTNTRKNRTAEFELDPVKLWRALTEAPNGSGGVENKRPEWSFTEAIEAFRRLNNMELPDFVRDPALKVSASDQAMRDAWNQPDPKLSTPEEDVWIFDTPQGQVIVRGKLHGSSESTGHFETMADIATKLIREGNHSEIYFQRLWRTVSGRDSGSGKMPDVLAIRRDATRTVDAWEVPSKTDTRSQLVGRMRNSMRTLPAERQGKRTYEPRIEQQWLLPRTKAGTTPGSE